MRIAYATVGSGYPLVVCPGWLSHLEIDWATPFHRAFWERLAERCRIVRYDRRGTGLSDRKVKDYSLEAQRGDLAAVIEATGEPRVALLGHCTGGSLIISYAAAHPEVASHLIFYDTFASENSLVVSKLADALMRLVDADWGGIGSLTMADMFYPGATTEQREAYAAYQLQCASKEAALAQAETISSFETKDLVKGLQTPSLVLHKRGDKIAPFELGRRLARNLPKSRFVPLDGDSNVIGIGSREATTASIEAIVDFLGDARPAVGSAAGITAREAEVLRLVAAGRSNREIAEELNISVNTVERHVNNVYTKIGASNRVEAASYAVRNGLA